MGAYSEKRMYDRYECDSRAYLYRYEDRDHYYDAGMYNYSSGGSYMTSDEKMEIGQQVYIKVKNHDKSSEGPEKHKNYYGYVKWSSELGTSYPGGQYGYGIEYAEPVYY